jgi:membrane-associated phospholipid phosphatase
VPAIAILVETAIFLSIASLVDRERPPVEKLDVAPPTSSYPSGHVGASTALYLAFAILALRIERSWLRRTTILSASPRQYWSLSPACTAECTT